MKITNKLGIKSNTVYNGLKSKNIGMTEIKYDEFMKNLVTRLKNSESHSDAFDIMMKEAKSGNLKEKFGVLFTHNDFMFQLFMENNGRAYENILKTLKSLNLSITPQFIEAISKGPERYIISSIKGQNLGELEPYVFENKLKVSKDAKISAFKDLQKLTKAGLVDDNVLKSDYNWYVTKDGQLIIPSWQALRKIRPDESKKDIMTKYYNILFKS